MKYKIEIWKYGNVVGTYESNSINSIIQWYNLNWSLVYENGNCSFEIYQDGVELTWKELCDLGIL